MLCPIEFGENRAVRIQLLNIRYFPLHIHNDFQIIFVLEGELTLHLAYANYPLKKGSIHIVHYRDVHSMTGITDDNRVLVLSFRLEYFQNIFPHFRSTVFNTTIENDNTNKSQVLKDQIFAMVSEEYFKRPGYEGRIDETAASIANILMKNFRGFVIEPNQREFIHSSSHDYMQIDRMSRIITYIYENYDSKVSLSEIAAAEHMSVHYLSHAFHKLVGISFRDFVNMVRIECTEPMVLETKKSITQIAMEAGFSDAKYYVSQFHQQIGYHPKEYRRLFSGRIYSKQTPDCSEIPLQELQSLAASHTQYPVFSSDRPIAESVNLNFTGRKLCEFNNRPALTGEKENVLADLLEFTSAKRRYTEIYKDFIAQETTVHLMQSILSSPDSYSIPKLKMIDTAEDQTGIITETGLKKPIYHFLQMLKSMPSEVFSMGHSHIACRRGDLVSVMLLNDKLNDSLTVHLTMEPASTGYKLLVSRLNARRSYLYYWSQLNFSNRLTPADVSNINFMSSPDKDYCLIPANTPHYMPLELGPYDITLLEFIPIEA